LEHPIGGPQAALEFGPNFAFPLQPSASTGALALAKVSFLELRKEKFVRHIPRILASVFLLTLVSVLPACAQDGEEKADAAATETEAMDQSQDTEKTFYAMGVAMAQNLSQFELSDDELSQLQKGLADGVNDTAEIDIQEYLPQIQALAQERAQAAAEREKAAAGEFLDTAAAAAGAVRTDSGLIYLETEAGEGEAPAATDTVKVHYTGKLRDGTVFDSSVERGSPATFPLNRVIACWTEGLQMMKVGGKATLTCPPDIAYGDRGAPPKIPGGAALTFDVELLEIVDAAAPAAPAAQQ
jgi:FKBP-type peptidyl-prolyl cis-trans isomerase